MSGVKISTFQERFSSLISGSEKTATRIAQDLHVSRQTISMWQSGERSPKTPTAMTIAAYFNVDIAWLAGYDVPKWAKADDVGITEIKKELIEYIKSLPDERVASVHRFLREMIDGDMK